MNAPRVAAIVAVGWLVQGCGLLGGGTRVHGSMRDVMRDGKTEGRVEIADAVASPHAIAIGALEGLKGEVLVLGGDVWIGRAGANGDSVVTHGATAGEEATLLIVDDVKDWLAVPLERDRDLRALEAQLAQTQAHLGLPETFPFVVEGTFSDLHAHVLDGKCPYRDPNVSQNTAIGASGRGLFVGFFTSGPAGILTHHGERSHVHVKLDAPKAFVGHVERVVLNAGGTLRLPRR